MAYRMIDGKRYAIHEMERQKEWYIPVAQIEPVKKSATAQPHPELEATMMRKAETRYIR